jgi:hypothetical protein
LHVWESRNRLIHRRKSCPRQEEPTTPKKFRKTSEPPSFQPKTKK